MLFMYMCLVQKLLHDACHKNSRSPEKHALSLALHASELLTTVILSLFRARRGGS